MPEDKNVHTLLQKIRGIISDKKQIEDNKNNVEDDNSKHTLEDLYEFIDNWGKKDSKPK